MYSRVHTSIHGGRNTGKTKAAEDLKRLLNSYKIYIPPLQARTMDYIGRLCGREEGGDAADATALAMYRSTNGGQWDHLCDVTV